MLAQLDGGDDRYRSIEAAIHGLLVDRNHADVCTGVVRGMTTPVGQRDERRCFLTDAPLHQGQLASFPALNLFHVLSMG